MSRILSKWSISIILERLKIISLFSTTKIRRYKILRITMCYIESRVFFFFPPFVRPYKVIFWFFSSKRSYKVLFLKEKTVSELEM